MRRVQNNKRRRCRQYVEIKPGVRYMLLNALSEGWYAYVSPYSPMIRRGLRRFIKFSIGGCVVAAAVFLFFGSKLGYLEAKYDLRNGHYEIRVFTSSGSHAKAYQKLLDPYGILYRRVDDYPGSLFALELVAAYNRIMKEAIRADLGVDVESLFKLFRVLDSIDSDTPEALLELAEFYEEIPLLAAVAWGGTSIVYPILHIYDLGQDGFRQIGELSGF